VWDYSNYEQLISPCLCISLSSQRRGWTCEAEEGERALRETEREREGGGGEWHLLVEAQHVADHVSGVGLLQHIPQQTRLRLEQVLRRHTPHLHTHIYRASADSKMIC